MLGSTIALWVVILATLVDQQTHAFIFEGEGGTSCPADAPCFCQSDEINCEGRHLTTFPNFTILDLPDDHFAVNIAENSLTTIPANAFKSLKPSNGSQLDLFMPENRLTSIDPDAFNGVADKVVWLYLDDNEFTAVPEQLAQLANLEELSIDANPITSLKPSAMTIMAIGQTLQNFYISLPLFTQWPFEFRHLTSLRELYVADVRLATLPSDAFIGFENTLTLLEMHQTEFPNVPEAICNLPNLETFRFVDNGHLTASSLFEKCPRNMASVKEVVLNYNHLTTMPNVFDMFPSIATLDLSENLLSSIDAAMIHMYLPLTELVLNYNRFTSIPSALGKLAMLQRLEMEDNQIHAVGEADLSHFTHLTDLSLANNPLTSLPDGVFQNNPNLVDINLRGTHLQTLPSSLVGLNQLKSLYFDQLECSCLTLSALKTWDISQIDLNGQCQAGSPSVSYYIMNTLKSCP